MLKLHSRSVELWLNVGMNERMKNSWADLESQSIQQAIELWHVLGREEFISRTRFRDSHRYVVIDRGQDIASKPLVAMAFQLQFGCGKDGPPRLAGGEQTRAILGRLGYELVDIQAETPVGAVGPPAISVGPSTRFWWANQSVNFAPVYEDGTLWAPLKNRRGQQVDHWRALDRVLPGDLVFHYASPEIRGLSRVATAPQPAYPPRGYNDVTPDTRGTLVLTEPLLGMRVPRDLALTMIDEGVGPVTASGTLRNGYVFSVDPVSGLKLLRQGGLNVTSETWDEHGQLSKISQRYPGTTTDKMATVAVRVEQRFLRNQQLRRWGNRCALCGRRLPEELLVAAHIKPRWACSEDERMDSLNVSMLACLFGCDALFELGYVVVDKQGKIKHGRRGPDEVEERVADMIGRPCPSHGHDSRQYFDWHEQHHVDA